MLPDSSNSAVYSRNKHKDSNVVYAVLIFTTVMSFLFIAVVIFYCWKRYNEEILDIEACNSKSNIRDELTYLENYIHGYIIHNGNHTTIRLGTHLGETIAVKVYPPRYCLQLKNEKEIYKLLPRHPNIAKFIKTNHVQDTFLFLTHYSHGSLLNYLWDNALSWNQLFAIIMSISNGLSFLHSESKTENKYLVVVHRNLNSRNILMKDNGECALADFALSLILKDTKPFESLQMVGSVRYMAPEVLSQNLVPNVEWKNALRNVDIYALALVLWEAAVRCRDITPDIDLLNNSLPYEVELGAQPCIIDVRKHVCKQRRRPKFPTDWNTNDPIVSSLADIIKQCWSQIPSTRLSAQCVLSKIKELQGSVRTTCHITNLKASEPLLKVTA